MIIKTIKISYVEIFSFLCLWYFYFSSSFTLRPFPQLFWLISIIIVIVFAIIKKHLLNRLEQLFLLSLFLLFSFSLASVDAFHSIYVIINYFIYIFVAIFLVNNCSGKVIINQIMFFSCIHLFCTLLEVVFPNIYSSVVLPLLPGGVQGEIIDQMNWNRAYYGFTVQTSINAMYLSIGAVLCAVKISKDNKRITNIVLVVLVLLFVIATFFTVRRGSSAALLFILLLIYFRNKSNLFTKILLIVSGIVMLFLVGINNMPGIKGLFDKASNLSSSGNALNGRNQVFNVALAAIQQRPFLGFGGGMLEVATGRSFMENSYLSIIVQWGVIGAIAFFAPYVYLFKTCIYKLKNNMTDCLTKFSFYIALLAILMSLVEDYFGAPINIFIILLISLLYKQKSTI